jgi:hypothetical protein
LPFGLGSGGKVDHDAGDADRVPERHQEELEPSHDATGPIPNGPLSTFQICMMRNARCREYRSALAVKK